MVHAKEVEIAQTLSVMLNCEVGLIGTCHYRHTVLSRTADTHIPAVNVVKNNFQMISHLVFYWGAAVA